MQTWWMSIFKQMLWIQLHQRQVAMTATTVVAGLPIVKQYSAREKLAEKNAVRFEQIGIEFGDNDKLPTV